MSILFLIFPVCILYLFTLRLKKRNSIITKLNKLTKEEKCKRINTLIQPFGYNYDHCQDSFHTNLDSWQRDFGYGMIYDKAAPHFNMIFDSMPIYFNYDGKTWLIEFWKGQYGINIGAEVGIYKSDHILEKYEYDTEIFQAVEDDELFPLSMKLYENDNLLCCAGKRHWWLTAFKMGKIAFPKDIFVEFTLTFPNCEILNAFIDALAKHPLAPEDIYGNGLNITFLFDGYNNRHDSFYNTWVMFKNSCFCKLFTWITAPLQNSMDQILYIYEYAPFAFRKLINIHSKQQYKKRR